MAKKILTDEQKKAKRKENALFKKLLKLQSELMVAKWNYPSQVTELEIKIYQLRQQICGEV